MTKEDITAHVIHATVMEQTEIASKIYRMTLEYDFSRQAAPGQFVNLYIPDKSMLLPRPISICSLEEGRISLVYRVVGKGTEVLAACKAGDPLRISTPLGHGYELGAVFQTLAERKFGDLAERKSEDPTERDSKNRTIALVAGGLGIPPMIELAKTIRKQIGNGSGDGTYAGAVGAAADAGTASSLIKNTKLVAILGFQHELFLTEELSSLCDEVHIATESGAAGFHGNVLDMMNRQGLEADYYLSCGPKPMLKALTALCDRLDKPLQISLEERMGCGYGACVGCTCRTREDKDGEFTMKQKKVCKDGPVFFGNEVIWDE